MADSGEVGELADQSLDLAELYQTLFDQIQDVVYVISPGGKILSLNPAFDTLTGWSRNEWVGKQFDGLIHPEDIPISREVMQRSLHGEALPAHEVRFATKSEGYRVAGLSATPFYESGNIAGVIGVGRDVAICQRAGEELGEAKEQATEATKEKDRYMSLIAHNLKSPFTSIIALLRLIAKEDTIAWKKYGDVMNVSIENAERAVKMIDTALHASRLRGGPITIRPRFFDGQRVAFEVFAHCRHMAAGKNIEIVEDVPEGTRLFADPLLFGEVLQNVMTNAIKFCSAGDRIRIFVPPGKRNTIAVEDTGGGVDETLLPDIFRADVKTTTAGTAGEKGAGRGLPLCREIMTAHGGNMTVESVKGKGSVFFMTLPNVRPKILLVDDDDRVRKFVKIYLEQIGAQTLEARNGHEALDTLKTGVAHLAVIEVHTEGFDDFALIERIKSDPDLKEIPVIVATVDSSAETRERAVRMGADDFTTKPFAMNDFIPRVRRFIV